jgi:hypothetical protein
VTRRPLIIVVMPGEAALARAEATKPATKKARAKVN